MGFVCQPQQGYFAEIVRRPPSSRFVHTLGGKNDLPGAVCLPCNRPLLLMISLDVRDKRLGLELPRGRKEEPLEGKPRELYDIPLLYCWSCGPQLHYRLNPEGGVDVLNHAKDSCWPNSCWPFEPYPDSFPRKHLRLSRIGAATQELMRRKNSGKLSKETLFDKRLHSVLTLRHQIGGEPILQQSGGLSGFLSCPLCDGKTPFIASVADETGSKETFHENSGLQVVFHYCIRCQVVYASHECD